MPDDPLDPLANGLSNVSLNNKDASVHEPPRIPFQKIVRPHHNVRDITNQFRDACEKLSVGQLVKDETFTLFDSVQALEIMDPKMDSGYLGRDETLEPDFDFSKPLLPAEIVGIMDQMLCYEMAWHQGYPLSQTLFTSLHIDKLLTQKREPKAIPSFASTHKSGNHDSENMWIHTVLRAFCIGVIKTCDIVIEAITSQQYYEEEDFHSQTYQRELLTDLTDDACIDVLNEAINWVQKQEPEYATPIVSHLEFRKSFIEAFMPTDASSESPDERWASQKERLMVVKSSHGIAVSVKQAFSEKMHRKLASTAPPRPSIALSFDDAITQAVAICDELIEATRVVQYEYYHSIESLITFLFAFAARDPQPSPFSRGVLQSLVLSDNRAAGYGLIEAQLLGELRETVLPDAAIVDGSYWEVEHPKDPRYQIARKIDRYVERAAPIYMDLLRAICQNRCRMRRCLGNILLEFDKLWEELSQDLEASRQRKVQPLALQHDFKSDKRSQAKALKLSGVHDPVHFIDQAICTSIQVRMLKIMQWIIQIGFEQDIYAARELYMLYWILTCCYTAFIDVTADIELMTEAFYHGKWKVFGEQQKDQVEDTKSQLLMLRARCLQQMAQRSFALGISSMLVSLADQSIPIGVNTRAPEVTSHLHFELRMKNFMILKAIRIPSFGDLKKWSLQRAQSTSVTLEIASKSLEEASKSIQALLREKDAYILGKVGCEDFWGNEWKRMLKSCISARLGVKALYDASQKYGANMRDHIEAKLPSSKEIGHLWWITPKISEN